MKKRLSEKDFSKGMRVEIFDPMNPRFHDEGTVLSIGSVGCKVVTDDKWVVYLPFSHMKPIEKTYIQFPPPST